METLTASSTQLGSQPLVNKNKPLDILLIYPGPKSMRPKTPFSIMALGSWIKKHGYSVKLMDPRVEEVDWDLILSAKMIGISSMTGSQLAAAVPLAKEIKTRTPETPIIWGGPHVSFFPEKSCESDFVDYVVEAEGEPVIIELMKKLLAGEEPEQVPGVTFKNKNGAIIHNPKPPMIDMELLDLPLYDAIDLKLYSDVLTGFSYESSRGCPYPCTFCYVYTFHDRTFRAKSPEKVLNEVKLLKQKYGFEHLFFTEDFMWVQKERALNIFRLFAEHKLDVKWTAFCRADFLSRLTDAEMEVIAKGGAEILTLGLESGSERMLKHIKKHITVEQAKTAIKKCVKHNIITTSSFIIGMPTETNEDLEDTIKMYEALTSVSDSVEINGFFIYTPYPGVPLYEEALKHGYQKMETIEDWYRWGYSDPTMNKWLTPEHSHRLETLGLLVRFRYFHHRFEYYSKISPTYKDEKLNSFILKMAYAIFMPILVAIANFRWKRRFFSMGYEWRIWRLFINKRFNVG